MTTNLFPQEIVDAIDAAVATTNANGSTELFVDGARTDTYLQNGTAAYPYKTITAAITVANAAALVDTVSRADLLMLGALFHDIGKGYPGDHTDVGIEMFAYIGPRMGLSQEDTAIVSSLIETVEQF